MQKTDEVAALENAEKARRDGDVIILRDTDETELAGYLAEGYRVQHMQFAQSEGRALDVVLRRISRGARSETPPAAVADEPADASPAPAGESPVVVDEKPDERPTPATYPPPEKTSMAHIGTLIEVVPETPGAPWADNFGLFFIEKYTPENPFSAEQMAEVSRAWRRWSAAVRMTRAVSA